MPGVHGAISFSTPKNNNFKLDPDRKEVKLREGYTLDAFGNGVILW